jgi:hypothetical protein
MPAYDHDPFDDPHRELRERHLRLVAEERRDGIRALITGRAPGPPAADPPLPAPGSLAAMRAAWER